MWDIGKEVRSSKKRYLKIEKPPTCKLDERRYRLTSEPEGDINPGDLPFTLAVTKLKGYFEAFFEQGPPFKLSLVDTQSEQTVWSATIREDDCVDNTVDKPRIRTDSRKRSTSSTSEEEVAKKRPRWAVEDPTMSSKQLLQVAMQFGQEWRQVAIMCLELSSKQLEDIQHSEDDVTMQRFKALEQWKSARPKGEATASHLKECLKQMNGLPSEVFQTLEDMMQNNAVK
ncbi:hypothetical protein UPYG_G00198550 [Umbra pygmaea]|uniref:FIIND domain-containing protein n=1 Tax=Umbra pygmaea TaxID=75934 RepID=A0ABD0WZU9_UMBPY